jgi:hypothetical protein
MTCVDGCRREKPLRLWAPFLGVFLCDSELVLNVDRDNFRDNRGDNRHFVTTDVVYT